MILPVNWLARPSTPCFQARPAYFNTLARAAAALPGGYAEYTLGGGATAGIYLFFLLTTLAAWSFEPKKAYICRHDNPRGIYAAADGRSAAGHRRQPRPRPAGGGLRPQHTPTPGWSPRRSSTSRGQRRNSSYAAAQCILPPLAFEQASSEACAAHKQIAGGAVLDLTCGLGADAFFLARRFRRVVALERDQTLARIAAENFRRLGAANIEVVNTSAEAYLAQPGLHFDWVYADPDRRSGDGRKLVRLEDCSPDILSLMPLIGRGFGTTVRQKTPRCSTSARRAALPRRPRRGRIAGRRMQGGRHLRRRHGPRHYRDRPRTRLVPRQRPPKPALPAPGAFEPDRYRWLVVPDVALQKARLARLHLRGKADIWSEKRVWFRHGAARGDNWQSIRNRTYRALRPSAAETRVQRPRRGVDETGLPVRRRRAGTAAGRTCRQRRTAGLHENRERFLGCTAGIAIFARLGQRPPRRHTGLGTAPPGYGNGNGL